MVDAVLVVAVVGCVQPAFKINQVMFEKPFNVYSVQVY